jgi:transcriptional regulator with GAF, ATPase, and Fis domain
VYCVDVRVVCATNVRLLELARARQFRLDLYYRLAIFPIEIPPLREQKRFLAQIVQPCHRANFT